MEQKSDEWKDARRGKITASRFGDVLASPTTKRYQGYMEDLKNELMGVPDFDDDEKPWFQHGIEWEDEARGMYEWEQDIDVEEVGIIMHPEYDFISGSPDGLIGKDGGIEIKSRKSLTQHTKSEKAGIDSQYKPQVQGYLWITGRKWWDFVSYYKSESGKTLLHVHRVDPDKKYHQKLKLACLDFWQQVKGGPVKPEKNRAKEFKTLVNRIGKEL